MVAHPVEPIIARSTPKRTPSSSLPLAGAPARMTAEIQGDIWLASGSVDQIAHHVDTGEAIDRHGDALLAEHRRQLRRAHRLALIEGASQTAALLAELIASGDRIAELDDAEDWHRRQSGAGASDADRSLVAANAVCMALLGQREADVDPVAPIDLTLAWPLDGAPAAEPGP